MPRALAFSPAARLLLHRAMRRRYGMHRHRECVSRIQVMKKEQGGPKDATLI
jgi:hypothetical protein